MAFVLGFLAGMVTMMFVMALCGANHEHCERAPHCREWVA